MAGTPSGYPQFFVFPMNWRPGSTDVMCIPPESVWGWHSFAETELQQVTTEGWAANPRVWYYSNALHVREDFPDGERRILRLPVGVSSADLALRRHLSTVLGQAL